MKISVHGLGYVGCVSAACLAHDGHEVLGVDINPVKVELLKSGKSPVVEPALEELVAEGVSSGNLQVSLDSQEAVRYSEISLICVGTPSNDNGSLKLDYVEHVCREIGKALAFKQEYHVIVIRSTVLPGTVEENLIPILEKYSGKQAGIDFGICMNPEFLREGSAVRDYYQPSFVIIGEVDTRSGDMLEELYADIEASVIRTTIRSAEMVKYACNAFHALKVVFANEIGNLSKANGIDGQEIMEIFCRDRQLNLSTAYLKPGFAFGGSCLPKDLRAMLYRAKDLDVDMPLMTSILISNQKQVELGIKLVEKSRRKKIGILGLSFKAGTDDLRESPAVILAETLLGRGYQICIFDDEVEISKLIGANKTFLEQELPHIASLMCSSMEELVLLSEVVVLTNGDKGFRHLPEMMDKDQMLIDLVGIAKNNRDSIDLYEGICW